METNKPLARAGYLLAALLVVLPLFDMITQVLPLQLGNDRWRFGVVGQLSNLLLVPLLGLLLAMAIATLTDSRRVKRIVGTICGVLALIVAMLAVLFILDYYQARTIVTPRFQHVTAVATITALCKHVLAIITLVLLSRAGFAGPKPVVVRKRVAPVTEPSATPLIPLSGAGRAE
jgi:hypothetical protein